MYWRGFGYVHRSRTVFCRAVPNPNITIRNFCIAVGDALAGSGPAFAVERAVARGGQGGGHEDHSPPRWCALRAPFA
jgi:hypothetical protein